MTEQLKSYCIDTSALIAWWVETYSPDIFETLPEKMAELHEAGRLIASRAVKEEIKDDPNADDLTLAKWCKSLSGFYLEDDEDVQGIVAEIMAFVASLPSKPNKGISGADPFVIARAEINGPGWVVVSAERPGNGTERNPNIPYICQHRDIEHIDFMELMRREGWKLR